MRHLHLDPLGGVAGDMFAAALLDAFPEHATAVAEAVERAAATTCRLQSHDDGVLSGSRFVVECGTAAHDDHGHAHWADIRARLLDCGLDPAVALHAVGIFTCLAEAEARVHGVAPEDVEFHEVGAVDSIADIVAAAVLVAAIGEASWSVGPLPLGSGRVQTAHGPMPVPAPATALLLRQFATIDDGIAGERVTPTGAAILQYLDAHRPRGATVRRLTGSGIGFGTRLLPGLSNCLRLLVFEPADEGSGEHRSLSLIGFEVDDQTPEDLATGLERLRATPGVHDVLQMPVFGKKGRMGAHIQVLARPEAAETAAQACFRETTTIGLRIAQVQGRALPRSLSRVTVGDAALRVKLVERPDGVSAKAESDDALSATGQTARAALRREAERLAGETVADGVG